MKQRNIKGASLLNPRIYHQSVLNKATLQCDSRWEHDYLIICEFDKSIKRFMTQPNSFAYQMNGKTRRYTPDVRIQKHDGQIMDFEIKDTRYSKKPELHEKIAHIDGLLKQYQDSSLTLVTSNDILAETKLTAMKTLYKFLNIDVPESVQLSVKSELDASEIAISDLEKLFIQKGFERIHAWAFLAKQFSFVTFNNNSSICPNTLIQVSN
ncbi:hypothetical protein JAO78_016365 [Alishewanella sp. 16-MA]|uniref:TnsA endonuclease N-terminal domain-containing protein n=1 Tax=Alishewanella maricola TaxID=2795740 RepID=A0ABS8C8U7_9ALTE|nr:hypothetical protein [Alishewanella maricola]MCB5228380.1 hypothetical protein [Alishewanella maricola]